MADDGSFWDDEIGPNLEHLGSQNDVLEALDQYLGEVVASAQQNAPWGDRTGAARAGLQAEAYEDGNDVVLELYHSVDYGIWLETIQNGAFSIIMPTLEAYAGEIFRETGARMVGG